MTKSFNKAFSTFVSLTTIVWSVGLGSLVMPNVASAATLSAGDLIKASGPAVYYYGADAKRYVFPTEKTYFSWYQDFSTVKTISDADLAAIPMGSINVTVRPGTKLVKITTDPKTYAVTPGGVLHWVESESVATALYGSAWATRVVDVPDGYWNNYTVGSSISTNVHPDGTIITYAGDTSKYVVMNGVKRKFNPDTAFAANGYNAANLITTTITYGNGSDVSGRESALGDTVSAGSVVVGGGLTVALASDTPAGVTVPRNSSSVSLVKVNLTAASGDVTVTDIQFHRVGVGSVSDLANVYLYDQDGTRLTTGRSISSATNLVEFPTISITIPSGTTHSVYLYGDFSSPTATGGQHAFEVLNAGSVVVSGSSTVSGSFPVRGNVFTVGTTLAARVDIQKGSQPSNPTIGSKQIEISNFKVTANTDDISLNQVTLYQAGSVTNSDLANFNLYNGSTLVATTPAVSANGHIVLKFNPAYVIANGTTKVFSLVADVGGRAGRTIRTYVEYTTDVSAQDNMYSAGASICINNTATGCTGSSANMDGTTGNYIEVMTQGGQLTNSFNGPTTGNIAKGQLAVPLYKFSLTSPDNGLEIRNMRFQLDDLTGGSCKIYGSSGTAYFRNIRVINLDTGSTWMGPKEVNTSLGATVSQPLVFTDTQDIAAGKTMNLALVADLASSEDTTGDFFNTGACQYRATFNAFQNNDVRVVDTGEFLDITKIVPNQQVTGNAQTVQSSGLAIALASNPVSSTLVKKQQNVAVAGITLTASSQSDITITNLTLTGQANIAGAGWNNATALANFSQRVTSLALFDGTKQVGLAKAPDTVSGQALISNMNLVIPKGTTKTLTIMASFSSTASASAPYDKIAVGIGSTANVQAQDQDANTVTPTVDPSLINQSAGTPSITQTVLNSGTVTIAADAHPVTSIVVAGKDAWVPMAQYKATAQYEDVTIDKIAVLASSTAGTTADDADFSYIAVAMNGAVKGMDQLPYGTAGSKDLDLSSNTITVPKGSSVDFQLWAKLSGISASSSVSGATAGVARSGNAPALGLMTSSTSANWNAAEYGFGTKLNVRCTGAASGERVYAAAGAAPGNSMIIRKTMPIVTKQSLSSTTLANIDMDLMKWQVAADSAGSVSWKQAIFSFSKSGSVTLSNFRLLRNGSDVGSGNYTVVDGVTGVNLYANTIPTTTSTGYIIVAINGEESISGSGNVYTLHASVAGASAGQNVALSFYRGTTSPVVTGYLTNVAYSGFVSNAGIFNLNTAPSPTASADALGTFVWSDQSEVPHSTAIGTSGGSRDWTNDVYVQDLSQSQSLSL